MITDNRSHNIVVCCDGTWCGQETGTRSNIQILADAFASKGLASNVSTKDAKPVEYNPETKTDVRYFSGVGLSGWEDLQKSRKDLPPLVSGLVGPFADTLLYIKNCVLAGDLPDRCKEAYSFIAEKYSGEENSRIWLFGLSRGAYTVRAVAGMINCCGILDFKKLANPTEAKAQAAAVDRVYDYYRSKKDGPLDAASVEAFWDKHSWPRGDLPPVVFMGLLDTVGAEGIPSIKRNAAPEDVINYDYFHDVKVSSEVQRVFHAVSAHDRLGPFEPCPVRRDSKLATAAAGRAGGYTGNYPDVEFTTQEVWYPGAHYDIGRQDFVLGNNPFYNRLNRELNPLSSNVLCSQELADYPLLGRALKAHEPLRAAASSSSSSSCGAGVTSDLCIVGLANTIQPDILHEPSEDAAWQKLVEGSPADDSLLLRGVDLGLGLVRRMGVFWVLRKGTAALPAGFKVCQPPATIDAESVRLEPVLDELAKVFEISKEVLLRDRKIPLPPEDEFGPVEQAVFFTVPFDVGGDSSYKARGRSPAWFKSKAYDKYRDDLGKERPQQAAAATQQLWPKQHSRQLLQCRQPKVMNSRQQLPGARLEWSRIRHPKCLAVTIGLPSCSS